MQIVIADDRLSAQVGETKLVVGGPITFKTVAGKMLPGIIMAFAVIDKKNMKAPWCYARDTKGENAEWFSLNNWVEQQAPQAPPPIIAPPPPQATIMTDNDML